MLAWIRLQRCKSTFAEDFNVGMDSVATLQRVASNIEASGLVADHF
jgi:hypothetical protein